MKTEATSHQHLEILDWQVLSYREALARQNVLVIERIAEKSPDWL